ncbi:hypothetical protein CDV31_005974 [Fusarium ambrosium]|uniref:Probable beta-glucosidase G n=1 Tax=Fusarium ambrosium TaxID=131363 RepID=A0A428UG57_9HYPO|nr:hypothetical protein CDV31_005974 [Fusarium ambrosium]
MRLSKLIFLVGLALLPSLTQAAWNHDDYMKSPGPEEIPNPYATGLGWEEAFSQASEFVSQLTLEEKVQLVSVTEGLCVGNIAPINRLNFSGLCIQNEPMALEQGTYTSVFPAGLTIAATWDKNFAYQRGRHMGDEFRGKGSHVILGPSAGPLGRHALSGRNWEGFSPDPYLTGELFTETIIGIQNAGVQACAKHYIGNEQETKDKERQEQDGREAMHELYLCPFQQAVRAGVATAAGTVLLKNINNTLPLKSPKRVGIFGNDAGDCVNGMSYWFFNGVGNYEYGVLAAGGGSGSGLFTYVVSPLEAIKQRVGSDGTLLQYVLNHTAIIQDDSPNFAALLPSPPDVCLVFLKSWATENEDRTNLHAEWNGDEVVEKIASYCPNTVVVTHSGGINLMPWADHPNVTAILVAHLPGQEAGNSIVDVLWGDVNPSGRLPYTIAKEVSDYSFAPITNSTELFNSDDPNAWQADFTEGLLIDYRHFDYHNIDVRYEFGFGLSYTTFSMGNATVNPLYTGTLTTQPPAAQTVPGGNPNLWEALYQVQVAVKNDGAIAGSAVPQLYLALPDVSAQGNTPKSVLRGFDKVYLQPGETKTVTFDLTRRDISYWDVISQQWIIGEGEVQAHVVGAGITELEDLDSWRGSYCRSEA